MLDLGATEPVLADLPLEASLPAFKEVGHRPLVDRPAIVPESSSKQWLADGFHVRVDAEDLAVDGQPGQGAAWGGRADRVEEGIPHELAHLAGVLIVVVEGQGGQSPQLCLLVHVVELDLQRGPAGVLGSNEPLLAESDIGKLDPVNRQLGVHVDVGTLDGLELAARLQGLEEVARLVTDRVPVLLGNGDLHIQHPVGRKQVDHGPLLDGGDSQHGRDTEARDKNQGDEETKPGRQHSVGPGDLRVLTLGG